MPLDDTLRSLLVAQGPSGYEAAPSAAWRAAAEGFADSVSVDTMGNLTARVPARAGGEDARTLAIVGHIDEIGLIVTHIDDKGRLFFIGVGGWDPQVLVSQRVDVTTRDGAVPGVIGRKAIHLFEEDERKKVADLKDLYIDIGARDGDEAKALVRVGDVAVIAGEPLELPQRARRLTRAGQPPRRLHRARDSAAGRRGRRRGVGRRRGGCGAGGGRAQRRAGARARPAPGRCDRRRRHARDRVARGGPAAHQRARVRLRPRDRARHDPEPEGQRAADRGRRGARTSRTR